MMDQGEQTVSLSERRQQKGLKDVTTRGTGNCQAYAIAQALAGSTFEEYSDQLVELSSALKQGCAAHALTDFSLTFPHQARKAPCWDKMANKLQQRNSEYGSSSSAISDLIEDRIWGSNDILAAYGMLLQRGIVVISHNVGGSGCGAIHY
ncbi:hypothetical protein GQ600_10714 [Phytophthora cactorum]|nr:hypothetical protein GQ600_10714 [Phytophthora cactorum]